MTARGYTIEEGEATIEGSSSPKATMREYGVSLVEGLTHLARRKGMIAKVTAIAMLVGVTLALVLPVQYTATTKLMPPQQTQSAATLLMSQLGNGAGSLAAIAGGGLSLRNPNDIYIGLLTSRPIADAIIQKFNLAEEYHARERDARLAGTPPDPCRRWVLPRFRCRRSCGRRDRDARMARPALRSNGAPPGSPARSARLTP